MAAHDPTDSRGLTSRPPRDVVPRDRPGADRTNGLVNGRGRTNGLVNGLGKTNGLVNGVGKTNGLVNGLGRTTGFVNGRGYVNGTILRRNRAAVVSTSDLHRSTILIAASLVAMLFLAYYMGTPAPAPSRFTIDGVFSEWIGVAQYPDDPDPVAADADLIAFSVQPELDRLFVYARARGPLFPGPEPSTVFLFIDNPRYTGYAVDGFDADYVVEVWGFDGAVEGGRLWEWTGGSDRDNATALDGSVSVTALASGTELEAMVPLGTADDLRFKFSTLSAGSTDAGPIVAGLPGALLATQRPLATTVSGVVPVLEVRFRALLGDVVVRGMAFEPMGGGTLFLPSFPFTVLSGQERTETIQIATAGAANGDLLTVRVASVDTVASGSTRSVPVTLSGPAARAYVVAAPGGIVIDGLFADWTNVTPDPDDAVPDAIDILGAGVEAQVDVFFYVRTEAGILAGSVFPDPRPRPPPTPVNGTPVPPGTPLRRASEDFLRVFVDSDDRDPAGVPIGGIVADRLLEVRGRGGRITGRSMLVWNETTLGWVPGAGTVAVAHEGTELEARLPGAFFGTLYNPRVVFEMTAWSDETDLTDLAALLAPSKVSGPRPLHGLAPQTIDAPLLVNTPVVDGSCTSFAGEYLGRRVGGTLDFAFAIGRRDDSQYVFVCISLGADTTDNPFLDFGVLVFDTLHDGGIGPQTDDRLFFVYNGDTFVYWYLGDGIGGWVDCTFVCDSGDAAAGAFVGTRVIYEFRIRYTDVWGTLTPPASATAGFGIYLYDGTLGMVYWWGNAFVDPYDPETWGHLELPEFEAPIAATSVVALVLWLQRRRRATSS